MKTIFFKTFFIFSLILLALPAYAAEVFFEPGVFSGQVGGEFEVSVFLDAQKEPINAFGGKVIFPYSSLELEKIKDGNSVVNFWIKKPKQENGRVIFSGITPGGFSGNKGLLFSMAFKIKKEGDFFIDLQNTQFLKNDGLASAAAATVRPLVLLVSGTAYQELQNTEDASPPEYFTPLISREQGLFEGRWFLAFATQDKSSGVNRYEIKESRQKLLLPFKGWQPAESPYVLEDQQLKSHIVIRAVDNAENAAIVELAPQNPIAWYENYLIWIIIGIVSPLIFLASHFWKKNHS